MIDVIRDPTWLKCVRSSLPKRRSAEPYFGLPLVQDDRSVRLPGRAEVGAHWPTGDVHTRRGGCGRLSWMWQIISNRPNVGLFTGTMRLCRKIAWSWVLPQVPRGMDPSNSFTLQHLLRMAGIEPALLALGRVLRGIHLSGPGTRCRAYKRPKSGRVVVLRTGHAAKSAQMATPET